MGISFFSRSLLTITLLVAAILIAQPTQIYTGRVVRELGNRVMPSPPPPPVSSMKQHQFPTERPPPTPPSQYINK